MAWLSATQTQAQSHTTLALRVVKARRVEGVSLILRGSSVVVDVVVVIVVVGKSVIVVGVVDVVVVIGCSICVEWSVVVVVAVAVVVVSENCIQ